MHDQMCSSCLTVMTDGLVEKVNAKIGKFGELWF